MIGEIMKPRLEWDKCLPAHTNAFVEAVMDTQLLLESHGQHLCKRLRPEQKATEPITVTESDSIFLRAAVVFLCSTWEAYIEDLLIAAAAFMADTITDTNKLPKRLRKLIANTIKEDKDESAVWLLADNGWRESVRRCVERHAGRLNNPKTANIAQLYDDLLGIDVLAAWEWEWKPDDGSASVIFSRENSRSYIDGLVNMRNAIAHGREPRADFPCNSFFLVNVAMRMQKVAFLMHNLVNDAVAKLCDDKKPWVVQVRYNPDWHPCCLNLTAEAEEATGK